MLPLPSKSCPACRGSGRVRTFDMIAGTQVVHECDVCRGAKVVALDVLCPEVRVAGTISVLNPGDPGYAEARERLDREERERHEATRPLP